MENGYQNFSYVHRSRKHWECKNKNILVFSQTCRDFLTFSRRIFPRYILDFASISRYVVIRKVRPLLFISFSGLHFLREVVHMLQVGKVEYVGKDVKDFPICYQSPEYLNSLRSPRTLHTHMPFRFLPKQHLNRKGKVIALFRNPKDNAVSNYHFISGVAMLNFDFQEFLDAFCEGKCEYNLQF